MQRLGDAAKWNENKAKDELAAAKERDESARSMASFAAKLATKDYQDMLDRKHRQLQQNTESSTAAAAGRPHPRSRC